MTARVPSRLQTEFARDGISAVLFDIDGTLYSQQRLRVVMAAEFVRTMRGRGLAQTVRLARIISAFRRTREEMRGLGEPSGWLDELQFAYAAQKVGVGVDEVRAAVEEWILTRPLKNLRFARRAGLDDTLSALTARGVRIGALSDYPTDTKLQAMGIAKQFSVTLCATDRSVNAFKPHPKGFHVACEQWGLAPQEVLYVGDRPEIDGAGAAAAGMHCIIVGRHGRSDRGRNRAYLTVRSFADLAGAVIPG